MWERNGMLTKLLRAGWCFDSFWDAQSSALSLICPASSLKQTNKKLDNNNFSQKRRKLQSGRSKIIIQSIGGEGGLCQTCITFWRQIQTYLSVKDVLDTSKEKSWTTTTLVKNGENYRVEGAFY